jgi:hypothetical protein
MEEKLRRRGDEAKLVYWLIRGIPEAESFIK